MDPTIRYTPSSVPNPSGTAPTRVRKAKNRAALQREVRTTPLPENQLTTSDPQPMRKHSPASNPGNKTSHLFFILPVFLLAFYFFFYTGDMILLDLSTLAERIILSTSPTSYWGAKALRAVGRYTSRHGKYRIGNALFLSSFVDHKRPRASGMLLLCEAVADTATTAWIAWKFGFESDIVTHVMVITVKAVIGWLAAGYAW